MKKHFILFFTIIFLLVFSLSSATYYADDSWPAYPDITSEAGILIDADSGAILYEKNSTQQMYPASITKIITAMVAIQQCSLDETVFFSEDAVNLESGAATLGFVSGEEISLKDSLYGLLLYSANECANAIAEHVSGSTADFALLMNEYAKSCGTINTHFTNPSGLFDEDHYTCCYDMALMVQTAVKNSTYLSIDGTTSYTIPATNLNPTERTFYHRQQMLFPTSSVYYNGVIGGKTGYLDEAGHTLVTIAKRDNMTLICVVMNSDTNGVYADTSTLLDYGYNNFSTENISENETKFSSDSPIFSDELDLASIDKFATVTIPTTLNFSDLTIKLNTSDLDDNVMAELNYYYSEHYVGSATLSFEQDSSSTTYSPAISEESTATQIFYNENFYINIWIIIFIIIILFIIIIFLFIFKKFNSSYSFRLNPYKKTKHHFTRIKDRKYRNRSRKKM